MEREKFKSRLGFILISAGCAIGIGNVWRFPYVVGNNGGGCFVLFYVLFLVILGLPILTMEFSVGRASQQSIARAFTTLEKKGQFWHLHGYIGMAGNYILMMFYTTVAGWMLKYFFDTAKGDFIGATTSQVKDHFTYMNSVPSEMIFWTVVVIIIGFLVCSLGLQNGVEKISKGMMIALLVIMAVLAMNSIFLKGASKGLYFYLVPDFQQIKNIGLINVLVAAMNQAFFTLSIGMGSMTIFGSYLSKDHSLLGESINIVALDTFVAIVSGLIIFPSCFAFGVNPDQGPSLIFVTLPNIFIKMPGGRIIGSCFFIFMAFAAFSTVIAVFENIMSSCMDLWGWGRKKTALIIAGIAKSVLSGVYKSHHCESIINTIDVVIPICTALFASFFPYTSLTMSVIRNVDANKTFPNVITIPNALTIIKTSMLAAIVAILVKQNNPCFPNNLYITITLP